MRRPLMLLLPLALAACGGSAPPDGAAYVSALRKRGGLAV